MVIEITEGVSQHGGYILKANGIVFNTLADVINAFPDDQLIFRPKPPKKVSTTMARDIDFDLFS